MYICFDKKDYSKVREALKDIVSDDSFVADDVVDLDTDACTINRAFTTLSHTNVDFHFRQ